ncbi:MAG: pyridoxamine 5'-phosphate oxidase family protein [Chitinophagales bacterium]|nr:pyridoxamine 5'-phosphate oxidase family protein [Chitinophagales bacterium]
MNKDIIKFIRKQKTATVCTVDEQGNPYCFSCFYVFDEEKVILIYKTHANSHHVPMMTKKMEVAGTILPGKADPVIVKGVQFEGVVIGPGDPDTTHASRDYHLRYPFALAMGGDIWVIRIQHIKMTDSSKGFGTKIEWNR